ncbi:MAG: hypothetical protein KGJ86_12510, partial [Chloroflexota bacterium]|nr:hypothetical protein [Chloroflexota bacterium]
MTETPSSSDAWPQDDLRARQVLLAFLEGPLPLAQAASEYVACFPPISKLSAEEVRRKWGAWSPAM